MTEETNIWVTLRDCKNEVCPWGQHRGRKKSPELSVCWQRWNHFLGISQYKTNEWKLRTSHSMGLTARSIKFLKSKESETASSQHSFTLHHHLQSRRHKRCCDDLLFLTMNVCFEKVTQFYKWEQKTHKDSASKENTSPQSSGNPCCLNTCPLIEPTDAHQRLLRKTTQCLDTRQRPETPKHGGFVVSY